MHIKALAAATVFVANKYAIDLADVEQVVAGLIFGLIQKDDLKKIQTCLKDGSALE